MSFEFKLPDIGEGVLEGELVEWLVEEGGTVTEDEPICSVLTDKATVEISSPVSGILSIRKAEAGDVIEVGSVIAVINNGGTAAAEKPGTAPPKNAGEASAAESSEGSLFDFKLPDIGEGVMEGEIVEWHVQEGDAIRYDDPILNVLTDKATVEITAPRDGKIMRLMVAPGDVVEVGSVVMQLQVSGKASNGEAAPRTEAPVASASTQTAAPKTTQIPRPVAASEVDPKDNPSISSFGTPLATPAVRRHAAEHGIDLSRVRGSGENNRITRSDVDRVLSTGNRQAAPAQPAPAIQPVAIQIPEGARSTREPIKGLRKAIYTNMARAKQIVPHFTYVDEVEMDQLIAFRNNLKEAAAAEDIKLTYLPFIAKALAIALKKFPAMNASVDDASMELVYKHYYNIGIATATKHGLSVPVVKDVDKKSIIQLSKEIATVTAKARDLKVSRDEISDGTFTITSLGRLGGLFATPIINHPEVAIFSVHNIIEKPVVRNGQIVIRNMMNVAGVFDHRVIDGDQGAAFIQEVKGYLENPAKLLLHMS